TIFLQSRVIEHAELHLLFSMITPLSWLERNPTYKEQLQEIKGKDLSTYGFLGYPVLQAADILIYRAETVPIGVDQLPHLELTREIARRFNFLYGNTFPVPEPLLTQTPKIPGLDGRKMSKSYDNMLLISDPPETIKDKILPMVTCPHRVRRKDPGHPEHCPVFTLHEVYSSEEELDYAADGCKSASIGCIDCKKIVIANINRSLESIQQKRRDYEKHVDTVMDILNEGSERAKQEAEETIEIVNKAVYGL
ncbi:MAG: tryptophan--tRNA ligase, partial [Thermodesulfobacteriota bacterium]